MKTAILVTLMLLGVNAFAQAGGVNLNEIDEGTTNIEIKKTKGDRAVKGEPLWELADGAADIEEGAAAVERGAESPGYGGDSYLFFIFFFLAFHGFLCFLPRFSIFSKLIMFCWTQ